MMSTPKEDAAAHDAIYETVLDGIARYSGDPFVTDVAETVKRYAAPYLAHALNKNQMASKRWLLDALHATALGGPPAAAGTPSPRRAGVPHFGTVYVLGGWYGVLGAMLLADARFDIGRVLSIDLDSGCVEIAEFLNRRHVAAGRFGAIVADMLEIDYAAGASPSDDDSEGAPDLAPDLVVNTSCEHLDPFADWYDRVPAGALLALQSNDMFAEPVHTNCVADLAAFRAQAPMAEELYAGALKLRRYTRFMLIGRK